VTADEGRKTKDESGRPTPTVSDSPDLRLDQTPSSFVLRPSSSVFRPSSSVFRPSSVLIAITCAAIFLAALDQTVVVTALPTVVSDLKIPVTNVDQFVWIVTAYLLGYTVAMPLVGRISDVAGHGRVFAAAVLVFIAGSLAVALAGGLVPLLAARVIQAAGGGAMVPVAMALVGDLLPAARRSVPLGLIGAASEAGTVLGPLWGALLIASWGWRSVFWINLPLGLLLLGLFLWRGGHRVSGSGFLVSGGVGDQKPETRNPKPALRRIDYPGAALIGAALTSVTLAATQDTSRPRPPEQSLALLGAGLLFLVAFVWWERRAAEPLVDLGLFRIRRFSAALACHFLVGAALIVALFDVPLYAYGVLGGTAADGGLILLRLTAAIPAGAVIGGFLTTRAGYGLPAALALALTAAGFAMLAGWGPNMPDLVQRLQIGPGGPTLPLPVMTLQLALTGFGFGLVIAPLASAVVNSVRSEVAGTASALHTVARLVGMTVGLAALSSWGTGRFNEMVRGVPLPLALPGEDPLRLQQRIADYNQAITGAYLHVFHDTYLIAMGLCLLGIVPALLLARRPA
jgi:MFS family permease